MDGQQKPFNIVYNIYVRGEEPKFISLNNIKIDHRPWKFVSHCEKFDYCFWRWGRTVGEYCDPSVTKYKAHTLTQCKCFYVQFDKPYSKKEFIKFLQHCQHYFDRIQTCEASVSIGLYEMYIEWEKFCQ